MESTFDSELPSSLSKRRVVICGSMSAYSEMIYLQRSLYESRVRAIVPVPEDDVKPALSVSDFEEFKRRVSFDYTRKIKQPQTVSILVVNSDKHGIRNYIGPNTFAEIAVAFAQRKRIFVYQGFPEVYEEELRAWRAVQLQGDLSPLIDKYLEPEPHDKQFRLI